MATIYAAADGAILRLLQTDDEATRYPTPPEGTADTLTFDAQTNADVLAGLNGQRDGIRWQDYTLRDGVLACQGEPVTVNQPTPVVVALDPVQAIVQAVVSAPDCPPGVRAAILAAQQAQAGQA